VNAEAGARLRQETAQAITIDGGVYN